MAQCIQAQLTALLTNERDITRFGSNQRHHSNFQYPPPMGGPAVARNGQSHGSWGLSSVPLAGLSWRHQIRLSKQRLRAPEVATSRHLRELNVIIDTDKFFLSPRIQTLKAIRAKIRPEPEREPLPPPKQYEPPRIGKGRRWRG